MTAVPRGRTAGRATRLAAFGCALVALLAALLVCSGAHTAKTARHMAAAPAATAPSVHRGSTVSLPPADATAHVCSAADHGPGRGSGCSGAEESSGDATLPGPPPQPAPAAPPRLPLVTAFLMPGPGGPLPGSDLSPDLHVLQILRA